MIRHALAEAWPWLALIGLGVAAVALLARDPKADEHDLSDYHEPSPDRQQLIRDALIGLRNRQPDDILPPAPAGMNAGSPLYAGVLFDTWHPEDADVVAARWLREIAAEQQAKAGIRPVTSPATDRDYTGSFPVVAVA